MGGRGAGSVLDHGGSGGSIDRVPRVAPVNAHIFRNKDLVMVKSDYDDRFIDFAHKNGGSWNGNWWVFPSSKLKDVREAAKNIYGLRDVRGMKPIYASIKKGHGLKENPYDTDAFVKGVGQISFDIADDYGSPVPFYSNEVHILKHAHGDGLLDRPSKPMLVRLDYAPKSLLKTNKDMFFGSYSEALKSYEKNVREYKPPKKNTANLNLLFASKEELQALYDGNK